MAQLHRGATWSESSRLTNNKFPADFGKALQYLNSATPWSAEHTLCGGNLLAAGPYILPT